MRFLDFVECRLTNVELEFQSLFYWMRFLDLWERWAWGGDLQFQSLFYWMRFLDYTLSRILMSSIAVSILVLLDEVSRHSNPIAVWNRLFCFNPCFTGWGFSTFQPLQTYNYSTLGFNPCFTGWGFSTILLIYICLMLFVSILVLLDEVSRQGMALLHFFTAMVSILVLLDEVSRLSLAIGKSRRKPSFNPCFTGWGFSTPIPAQARGCPS